MLNPAEVMEQSKAAERQWGETWAKHAEVNGQRYRAEGKSIYDLKHHGVGKTILACGYAPSFEKKMDIIKKYKDNVDIACVDKCLGHLLDNDIRPDYVFVADAGIDYDKWLAPWADKTEGITLLMTITANPKWQQNWRGPVYFYVNKDNINTQEKYGKQISQCNEMIPASSNVGNSVIVFSQDILNYDQYLLVGYDFGWKSDEPYYAYTDSDKRYWMCHAGMMNAAGEYISTSQNLMFSARWLADYNQLMMQQHGKTIMFNCSESGILNVPQGNLERRMKKAVRRKITDKEREMIIKSGTQQEIISASNMAQIQLNKALETHKYIAEISIKYIKPEVLQWVGALQ